tara:strand:+ start:1108 stop:1287 length:180 start_codon:yes stop_codon:yes gene_type:complete
MIRKLLTEKKMEEFKFKIEIEGVDGTLFYYVPNDGQTEQEAIEQVDYFLTSMPFVIKRV